MYPQVQPVADFNLLSGYTFDQYGLIVLVALVGPLELAASTNTQRVTKELELSDHAVEDDAASAAIVTAPPKPVVHGPRSSPLLIFPNIQGLQNGTEVRTTKNRFCLFKAALTG